MKSYLDINAVPPLLPDPAALWLPYALRVEVDIWTTWIGGEVYWWRKYPTNRSIDLGDSAGSDASGCFWIHVNGPELILDSAIPAMIRKRARFWFGAGRKENVWGVHGGGLTNFKRSDFGTALQCQTCLEPLSNSARGHVCL